MKRLAHAIVGAIALAACAILMRPTATLADEPGVAYMAPEHELPARSGARLPEPVLAVEVLAALGAWTKQPDDMLRPWAAAIADGVATRREAILLASIGADESQFLPWVLDGRCNDATWRASRTGWERSSCDSGFAVSAFQRHSKRLVGASPDAVVADAVKWLRAWPQAWTTWREARAQADVWLSVR